MSQKETPRKHPWVLSGCFLLWHHLRVIVYKFTHYSKSITCEYQIFEIQLLSKHSKILNFIALYLCKYVVYKYFCIGYFCTVPFRQLEEQSQWVHPLEVLVKKKWIIVRWKKGARCNLVWDKESAWLAFIHRHF